MENEKIDEKQIMKMIEAEVVVVSDAYKNEWEIRKDGIKTKGFLLERTITVSAVVICKNEQENIYGCIESIQRMGFDEIVVIDTGSSDQTVNIVEQIILDGSNVSLYHYIWNDDFAAARNFGIDHAACEWIFFIDADERFMSHARRSVKELISYYSCICGTKIGICPVIISSMFDKLYNNPRIFNKKHNYKYYGSVHEMLRKSDKVYEPIPFICLNIQLEHTGYTKNKMNLKLLRNMDLLDLNIERERDNPLWYCYKLRDGRDILKREEKKRLYQLVFEICKNHLEDNFYLFCFDWASVLMILSTIHIGLTDQAQIYYDELIKFGNCSCEDAFYLETLIELFRMDLRLRQLEKQCHDIRNRSSISTSMINTQGYHIDELIMKLLEKQHKMGEYIKYCDFLFSIGYFTEIQ